MGALTSKVKPHFTRTPTSPDPPADPRYLFNPCHKRESTLVLKRRGSMYFDEDGDLAHEFYVEVSSTKNGGKPTMERVTDSLKPQGDIALPIPRLHGDCPAILCQVEH